MLRKLNLETLEERRIQAKLTMAFKIINGYVILDPSMLPKQYSHRPIRQCFSKYDDKENELMEFQPKIQIAGHTFFFSAPKLWNQRISKLQAEATSVDSFKRYFRKS